jgi:pilus assembly protein Flp/PilA
MFVPQPPSPKEKEFTMNLISRFIKDESGATAIEYGLIAGLVAVAAIAALSALGTSLDTLFSNVATTVASAT